MAGIINQTWFCMETVNYYVHTRILLRESCVIQTTVLVNSDDRRVYCSCRSSILAANKYYLARVVSPAFSSTSFPRSPSLYLSQISAMAPPVCPRVDEESPPPEGAHSISSDEDPYAPPDEVAPGPPNFGLVLGPVQSLSVEFAAAG